jgi:hypothetical protein
MARLVAGHHRVCTEICDALGFEPNTVRSLDIHLATDAVATVTAGMYVKEASAYGLRNTIKEYNLHAVEDNPLRNAVRGMISELEMGII